jgi:2-phosphoglycerate kinase
MPVGGRTLGNRRRTDNIAGIAIPGSPLARGTAERAVIAETAPAQFDPEYGFAYAKGLIAKWLMTTGLAPDRAWDLARRVEDHVARRGRRLVSLEELRALGHEVLGEHEGDETADRLRRWHEFETLERPLIVLIGGGTGVGKSTVATQLAYSLGITRVSSTDFIRQVLRSVVPEAIAPELSRSSFELDDGHPPDGDGRHAEFERQAGEVMVGVRATIERAVAEGMSLIVEGIHLLPQLVDLVAVTDGFVVYVVLSVEDGDDHRDRFALRARAADRPAARYQSNLGKIRALQDHVVATASRAGIPVLANRHVDTTVRSVLDLIFAKFDEALPPGQLKPECR